jgi:hypothetical protein
VHERGIVEGVLDSLDRRSGPGRAPSPAREGAKSGS